LLKTKAPGAGDAGDLGKASSEIEDLSLTKIASTSKAAARHDQTVAAVLGLLAEKWPACFQIFEQRRRPLKIGIHLDIAAALDGMVTPAEISITLRYYVNNPHYLDHLVVGADRIDLNGNAAGTVTAAEAEHAARIVARRRQKKMAAKPAAAKPPQRLGLAHLKRAALERKAAAP
jgi:ProP effector